MLQNSPFSIIKSKSIIGFKLLVLSYQHFSYFGGRWNERTFGIFALKWLKQLFSYQNQKLTSWLWDFGANFPSLPVIDILTYSISVSLNSIEVRYPALAATADRACHWHHSSHLPILSSTSSPAAVRGVSVQLCLPDGARWAASQPRIQCGGKQKSISSPCDSIADNMKYGAWC